MPRPEKEIINVGDRFDTNTSGKIKVVDILSTEEAKANGDYTKKFVVKFVKTGFQTIVNKKAIQRGTIKDPYHRSVRGVGYIGEGRFKPSENGKGTLLYTMWGNMMARCYGENNVDTNYKDVVVDPRWHCFQTFAEDVSAMPSFGKPDMELDKDIISPGVKAYGPDTCCLIPSAINFAVAKAYDYETWKRSRVAELTSLLRQYRGQLSPEARKGLKRIITKLKS